MIDYQKIADAVTYFQSLGYKYVEVPWIVRPEISEITNRSFRNFETFMGNLVASGEQSFLDIRDTFGQNDKRVCVTPCFRDEEIVNEISRNWFIKAELIIANPTDERRQRAEMFIDAYHFFKRYDNAMPIETLNDTSNDYYKKDIGINGLEVGSYGIREYNGFKWIYGTACAEPRLSQSLKRGTPPRTPKPSGV